MIVQLFESLVETVGRQEEGLGIGNMYRYGHAERSARLPHRIKPPIVYFYQRTFGHLLPQIQAERLEDLKASCSCFFRALHGLRLHPPVVGTMALIPQRFSEGYETLRVGLLESRNRLL